MLPDVPAVDEGKVLKGFHYEISTGYFVKKDTPEPVVVALHKALSEVLGDAEVKEGLSAMGVVASAPLSLDAVAKDYAKDAALYRGIAKAINLQAQ